MSIPQNNLKLLQNTLIIALVPTKNRCKSMILLVHLLAANALKKYHLINNLYFQGGEGQTEALLHTGYPPARMRWQIFAKISTYGAII